MAHTAFWKNVFAGLSGSHTSPFIRRKMVRCIYSKTGVWVEDYKPTTRQEVEAYWKIKLENYMKYESQASTSFEKGDKEKYYVLSMFPYPSGKLHMGHVRVYMFSDVVAHFHRMNGKQVLHPIGWDAFGLPAENAAIERGLQADEWTYSNIDYMRKQLKDLGMCFNWEQEVTTCSPDYYRWTQALFVRMFKAGMAYQKEAIVNWDPVDQTVLANEQVDENGKSWRSGAKVERRLLKQWFLRRCHYNKALVDSLEELKGWPSEFKTKQAKWIGKCDGCLFNFKLPVNAEKMASCLPVHTASPELIYGAAVILLAPFNTLLLMQEFVQCLSDEVKQQIKQLDNKKQQDINLGVCAIHPLTNRPVPIYVSNSNTFFNKDTQIETILGIPSASKKEAEFARKNEIEFTPVLQEGEDEDRRVLINSGQFSGLTQTKARVAILDYVKDHSSIGEPWTSPRQFDWLVSRQRYWGTPIPIIHCSKCKEVPVPEANLPVILPILQSISHKGVSPLQNEKDWLNVKCPQCGGEAKRETDTMDTFVDSAWYFLRYADPQNVMAPFDKNKADSWMPVDVYVGGEEHVLLHLLLARFFNHFLHDQGMVAHKEPFKTLLVTGYVKSQSYKGIKTGQYLAPHQVDFSGDVPISKDTGEKLTVQWEKMSKSKHNGVDPEELIAEYGVDAVRTTMMRNSPRGSMLWKEKNLMSQVYWIRRMWKLVGRFIKLRNHKVTSADHSLNMERDDKEDIKFKCNYTIKQVTDFYETSISQSVEAVVSLVYLTSELIKLPDDIVRLSEEFEWALCSLCIMVAPFAPHAASEMWRGIADILHHKTTCDWERDVLEQKWPCVKESITVPLIVKINNSTVGKMHVPAEHRQNTNVLKELVLRNDIGQKHLENASICRVKEGCVTTAKIPYINFIL